MFDDFGRIADNYAIGRNVFYDNASCTNSYIVPDTDVSYDNRTCANLHIVSYGRQISTMGFVRANSYIMPNLAIAPD